MHGICVYRCDKMLDILEELFEKWYRMENHIITGVFRGNRVMTKKNRMMGHRTLD